MFHLMRAIDGGKFIAEVENATQNRIFPIDKEQFNFSISNLNMKMAQIIA